MTADANARPEANAVSPASDRDTNLAGPAVLVDERLALLDVAANLALTGGECQSVVLATVTDVLKARVDEVEARGTFRRETIGARIAEVEAEIVLRDEVRAELQKLKERRSELQALCATLDNSIAGFEAALIKQRHAAEDAQLASQLAALDHEEQEAQRRAASVAFEGSHDDAELDAHRREAIALLEKKRAQAVAAAAPAFSREQALATRFITQTVSGFLLWLGYGSVAATGAVLALMLNGGDTAQFGLVIDGWRAIVESIPGDSVLARLGAGVFLVAVLLTLVGASIHAAEKLFLRKRDDWNRDEQRHREPHVNLSPQSITRKTYTQFIALLPFLFAAGILCTILAVTPSRESTTNGGGTNAITSVLPTLGYAFVGIVIAFLATAVFVMYVVRIVEPRGAEETSDGVLRRGWEFIVPPLVLIIAIVATPFFLSSGRASTPNHTVVTAWVLWAAFMLISSLCLACGVVYHGIFKDAKTAHERIEAIEAQLDIERALLVSGAVPRDESVAEAFAEERRRLLGVRRDKQLARLGVTINGAGKTTSMLQRAWRWIVRKRRTGEVVVAFPVGSGPDVLLPIDYEASPETIAALLKARTEQRAARAELVEIETTIRDAMQQTAFEIRLPLVQRRALLTGEQNAVAPETVVARSRIEVAYEHLKLQVRSVLANAMSVKPFFEGVRSDLAGRAPFIPNPLPPTTSSQGDPHE